MPANPKPPKPIRDAKHLENIRQCCCVICGTTQGIAPHHLLRVPEKAAGRRSGDNWTVPLCHTHHQGEWGLHTNGDEHGWFALYDMDGPRLAEAFWNFRGDLDKMQGFAQRMTKVAEIARRAER